MKRKGLWIAIAVVLVVVIGVVVWQQQKPAQQEEKVIKIGAILPLTGDLGFIGDFEKKSLELALKQNRSIRILYEDSKASPKDAVNAAQKLITVDRVKAIISSLSFISESMAELISDANIPHFILSFSPELPRKSPLIIRYFTSSTGEAHKFVEYIQQHGYKKVVFIRHLHPDAEKAFQTITRPSLEANGITVIDEAFPLDTRNFTSIVQRVNKASPDLIVVQAFANYIPQIISRIREYKIKTPILGDLNFLDLEHFPEENLRLVDGIPFVGVSFVLKPAYRKYVEEYQNEYKEKPFALGAFCYDLSKAIADLSVKKANPNTEDFLQYFTNTTINGVCGEIKMDEYGDSHVLYQILQYKNGEMRSYP